MVKQLIVVAYDIADDRRRQQIAKIMEEFGCRCNYSVFECFLSKSMIIAMQKKLSVVADSKEDSILYYYLCKTCIRKAEFFGKKSTNVEDIIWA
jgi:CRISPR-associated protein Cas2